MFGRISVLDRNLGVLFGELKRGNWSWSSGLKGFLGRTRGGNNCRIFEAIKIKVVVKQEQDRMEKRKFHSKFSKHQDVFLHKSDMYASHDPS